MAVEARRMNHLLPSHFITNSDFMKPNQQGSVEMVMMCNSTTQMAAAGLLLPEPETVWGSGKAESGLTSNLPAAPPRKRTCRRSVHDEPTAALPLSSFFNQQHLLQHHHSEIDRFLAIHTEKMRMEMEERKKRQSRILATVIEERVARKLKEKDEEIQRMGKLNWVLEERVKRLCLENQLWRDLAETNEAAVNSLRTNLEQVLQAGGGGEEAEDAQSSCGTPEEEEEESGGGDGRRCCRKCGAGESRVLVLPCRHLCLCTMCGSTLHICPVCNSAINATIHVNFS